MKQHSGDVGAPVGDANDKWGGTVRARRFDTSIHVEGGANPESVPRAVRVPPPLARVNSVRRGHHRERVKHPEFTGRGMQDECVCVVKTPPARRNLYRLLIEGTRDVSDSRCLTTSYE